MTQQITKVENIEAISHKPILVNFDPSSENEIKLDIITECLKNITNIGVLTLPVYTSSTGTDEDLIYKESDMDLDKLYKVKWRGKQIALRRTKNGVEMLEFVPDEK